jgi:hypothetical protein
LEGGSNIGGRHEEVASSPQEPFLVLQFDTIEVARAHYNAYAKKMGFSVKTHTSKRKAHTNELKKQQLVCKFHIPKTEERYRNKVDYFGRS